MGKGGSFDELLLNFSKMSGLVGAGVVGRREREREYNYFQTTVDLNEYFLACQFTVLRFERWKGEKEEKRREEKELDVSGLLVRLERR